MLRWPARISPKRYEDTLVNSIDLAPTILAAAGLKPSNKMPGVNLLEVIKNDGKTNREAIFGEIFEHDVADIDEPAKSLLYRWTIAGDWKLILPKASQAPAELYNLQDDPHETKNLAKEQREIVERLSQGINRWWDGNLEKPRSGDSM
jgi:uncharacterized sulfatase